MTPAIVFLNLPESRSHSSSAAFHVDVRSLCRTSGQVTQTYLELATRVVNDVRIL